MSQTCTDNETTTPPMTPPMTPLRYLAALWGGSHHHTLDKSGPEKRFEIDFQAPIDVSVSKVVSWEDWEPIMEELQQQATPKPSPFGLSIVGTDISVVVNREKLVITSGSTVNLHLVFKSVVALCESAGAGIHWASFMHKETTGPTAKSQNTIEFASLHDVFPTGHPFFLGPITSDHYFYYIYDSIDRTDPKVHEDEVQVNAVYYGVKGLPSTHTELHSLAHSVLGGTPEDINIVFGKDAEFCATRLIDEEFFATLRVTCGPIGTVASFETNDINEAHYKATLLKLCGALAPQRFSVVLLLDPQSLPNIKPQGPLAFDKFSVWNATTTELYGYFVKEINFVPSR